METKINDYSKGRLSVINEVIKICESKIQKARSFPIVEGDPKTITRSGVIKGLSDIVNQLKTKRQKTLAHGKNT